MEQASDGLVECKGESHGAPGNINRESGREWALIVRKAAVSLGGQVENGAVLCDLDIGIGKKLGRECIWKRQIYIPRSAPPITINIYKTARMAQNAI